MLWVQAYEKFRAFHSSHFLLLFDLLRFCLLSSVNQFQHRCDCVGAGGVTPRLDVYFLASCGGSSSYPPKSRLYTVLMYFTSALQK